TQMYSNSLMRFRSSTCATCMSTVSLFFFFFQAEDGIRDATVTGVQTCALPILTMRAREAISSARAVAFDTAVPVRSAKRARRGRSEERRVGKEGRGRWGPDDEKKKGSRKRERQERKRGEKRET